jgi:DNA repair photolyase
MNGGMRGRAARVEPGAARSVTTPQRLARCPFEQSINPYRGCERGCIHCCARPSHAYLDLSPGLDSACEWRA